MAYFYRITVDGTVEKVKTDKKNLTLQDCYKATESDIVQMVHCYGLKHSYTMVLDEEGKLTGRFLNMLATMMYANPYDVIVGTVVITKTAGFGTFNEKQCEVFEDELRAIYPDVEIMEV